MSTFTRPDEITSEYESSVSDCNMSGLMKDDNILSEEAFSSSENNNTIKDACNVETKPTNCNTVPRNLVISEKNKSTDNSVSNNSSCSKEDSLSNENIAVSNSAFTKLPVISTEALNNVSNSETSSLSTGNHNEISNDISVSEKNPLTDSNNEISNDVIVSEKNPLADSKNNEISNDVIASEKNSLADNKNNEISNDVIVSEKYPSADSNNEISDVIVSEKNSLTDNNEILNNVTDSERNCLADNNNELTNDLTDSERNCLVDNSNELTNDLTDSEKNSLADNNSELSNDLTGSKKISSADNNNEILNVVADSEKNSLVDNKNELSNNVTNSNNGVSNGVTDSEKNSLTYNNNEKLNGVSDSETSSNFDLNTENVNDTIESTSPEHESDIQKKKSKEIKSDVACNPFEAKRLEYEEVLLQCRVKLETLGKDNISLRHQVSDLKVKLNQQEVEYKKKESSMKAELLANIEKLSRDCNILHKEKEATVIRYANSEKEVIQAKKLQQELEKKIKDLTKDRDSVLLKLKNASSENSKLTSSLENKMVEIAKLQKENEKLNADCNSREIRIKWLQNKLKTEVSAHQETQGKLEHTLHRLNEMREEAEQVRRDCQEMIKCYQEAEEIKSVKLDSQLKQKLTELEVQKQEKCDQEQVYTLLKHELDALKKKQRLTMDENNTLTLKINSMEKERLEYEQTICKLKDNQNLLKEEIADMTSRLTEMEGLKLQLEQEREKSAASLREVERLRLTNAELQSDLDACHVKEGDRLDFVEKLTAKTMLLQSDHCLLEVKAQALEDEVNQLKKVLTEVQQNYSELVSEFENAKKEHENEMQLLVQKLAEKAKTVEKLITNLEEAENENRVLKRRHIASIKELSRELYQCKKRLESYESNCGIRAESVSLGSRTSSSASLHVSNSNDMCHTSPSITYNSKKDTPPGKNGSTEFTVDKEVLIERILNLQKMLAKKTDKIDFLEDHIEQLQREIRKKTKSVDFKNV